MPTVQELVKGYGDTFPDLETLFGLEPTDEQLLALSQPTPAQGRYLKSVKRLSEVTSQRVVARVRFRVLIEWLIKLSEVMEGYDGKHRDRKIIGGLTDADKQALRRLGRDPADAIRAEEIEKFTEHDTAAAGDYLKLLIGRMFPHLEPVLEGVHFGNTSEDVMGPVFGLILNSLVYGHFLPKLFELMSALLDFVDAVEADGPLIIPSYTHQQAAEPTTFGKKVTTMLAAMNVHVGRLLNMQQAFTPFPGKFGGGVGNMSTHFAAYPDIPWREVGREYVEGLGLTYEPMTFQSSTYAIEASLLTELGHIMTHLMKFVDDFVSLAACPGQFFVKRVKKGRKGSSIFPGKSNAWGSEGALAMLEKARAAIFQLVQALPFYPHEGDMKRSFLMRDIGTVFMPAFIALDRIRGEIVGDLVGRGYTPNRVSINAVFSRYPGMAGSCLQTVLKRAGIEGDAYRLVEGVATRADGTPANARQFRAGLRRVCDELQLTTKLRRELMSLLKPANIIGDADVQAKREEADLRQSMARYSVLLEPYQQPLIEELN